MLDEKRCPRGSISRFSWPVPWRARAGAAKPAVDEWLCGVEMRSEAGGRSGGRTKGGEAEGELERTKEMENELKKN